MRLIREDLLEKLDAKIFYIYLIEYLNDNDEIQHANYYWSKEHPNAKFNPNYLKQYAQRFPVKDIKKDIHAFVTDFSKWINSLDEVKHVQPDISTEFGFSDYIFIDFNKPSNPKLEDFYNANERKYKHVKIRFSDHSESNDIPSERRSALKVNFHKRTFLDAADEMKQKILKYIDDLHKAESDHLEENESKSESYNRW